jgi:DNA polymerase-3 subunit alpha
VIKVAHHFAGMGLDESDVLRRGMSGKYRSMEILIPIHTKHCQLSNILGNV